MQKWRYGGEQKRLTFRTRNQDCNYDCNEDFTRKLLFVIMKTLQEKYGL